MSSSCCNSDRKSTKMAQVAAPVDVEKCSNDVHMLVVPYPARGHNLVCIQLARKFLPYGVRVTLANIFDNLSPDLLHVCQTENITVANLGVCPADPGPGNLPFMGDVESVQGETEQLVANFASGTDSLPVTCIVGDILLGWTQVRNPSQTSDFSFPFRKLPHVCKLGTIFTLATEFNCSVCPMFQVECGGQVWDTEICHLHFQGGIPRSVSAHAHTCRPRDSASATPGSVRACGHTWASAHSAWRSVTGSTSFVSVL